MKTPELFRARLLGGVPHGFAGRRGGVSAGEYATLNAGLGSEDAPEAIAANRAAVLAAVAPGRTLVSPYQVHSADCLAVFAPFTNGARPHADALVTDRPGFALGIVTADCAPVLLADDAAGIVGAAHAGWKGALGGIVAATVAAMEALGAKPGRIVAAIGPCIARASYEVDAAFRGRFAAADPANERFFADARRAGHAPFDLEGYVAHRLAEAGVTRVEALGLDTYADDARFFSYRRATHRGEKGYGRQLSVIALP